MISFFLLVTIIHDVFKLTTHISFNSVLTTWTEIVEMICTVLSYLIMKRFLKQMLLLHILISEYKKRSPRPYLYWKEYLDNIFTKQFYSL